MVWFDIFLVAIGLLFILVLIKNEITYKHQCLICDAIYLYHIDVIENTEHPHVYDVEFDDMEDYDRTFTRWWDWGYKRILPPEKYEIIKDYIPKAKAMKKEKRNGRKG